MTPPSGFGVVTTLTARPSGRYQVSVSGFDRAIGLVQLGFPGPEIRLLRQLARGAQAVEHAGIVGVAVEKRAVEVPQPAIGIVVERQPPLAVEHRDAGRQLIERAAMRLRHPHQRRAKRGGFAGVDGDADASAADIERMDIVDAPLAADHDRQPRGEGRRAVQCAVHIAAVAAVEQFEVAIDRIRDAAGFGGARIGGIGVAETAVGALGPDRPGCGGGEAAQHFGFFRQRLVPQIGFRQFPAQPGEFANPYNGLAADGAPHGFDGMSVRGGEIEQKTFAGLAQRVDRMVHLQRRFRRQPGSEGEDALRRLLLGVLRHQQRGVAADLRAVVARRPGYQDLRFREQQRPQAVGLDLQARRCRRAAGLRFWWRLTRVRISRIAATTEKPSSASAVVSTANSW